MQGLNFDKNKIKQNQKDPTVLPPELKWQSKTATIYWPHIYSGSEVTGSDTGYLNPPSERTCHRVRNNIGTGVCRRRGIRPVHLSS